jgi:Rrf2 family transcriptional regulator, iron-sulfur cluster assembly transcription factor
MLSNTSRYALRALIYLAIHEDEHKKSGITKIAADLSIPSHFLGKILQNLVRQKLLISTKGPNGGFSASAQLGKTTLFDVISIIDGKDLFDKCLISDKACTEMGESRCSMHNHYEEIRIQLRKMFCERTISDLASEFKHSDVSIDL